jgi:hypothetical protein
MQRTTTLPPVDSQYHWTKLMNLLFIKEQDGLFEWLRAVRAAVEEAERQRRGEAA